MVYKSLSTLSTKEKNKLAEQYKPLISKIVKQFYDKGLTQWDQLESMAWEGFALAINRFDPNRSKLNFTQYAAFAIRNNILTSLDNELRTVKMSNYNQKIAEARGDSLFNTVSLDHAYNDEETNKPIKEFKYNAYSKAIFSDGDVFDYMYKRLEEQFTVTNCEIFYKSFGLKGNEYTSGKDIAKEFQISEGSVSQRIKKMTTWIRKDNELCEMLSNLL